MAQNTSGRFTHEHLRAVSGLKEVTAMARCASLNMAAALGGARLKQLTRDRDRALRRGDSARAVELEAMLARQEQLNNELVAEAERESIVPKPQNLKQAVYRGRVTEGGRGRSGLVVALIPPSGKPITAQETGPRGAFELPHSPSKDPLQVRVADREGNVFLSRGPLKSLDAGHSSYLELPVDGVTPKAPATQPAKKAEATHIIVPSLTGLSLHDARKALKDVRLQGRKVDEAAALGKHGLVISQDPKAGMPAKRGSTVSLVVGVEKKKGFPDLNGKTLRSADTEIRKMGLRRDSVVLVRDKNNAGKVIGQAPEPDGPFTPNSRVSLRVATGNDEADTQTAITLFGTDKRTESLDISEVKLRNRLKKAKASGIADLRKLTTSPAGVFAERLGFGDKGAAKTAQSVLAEIARRFPEG